VNKDINELLDALLLMCNQYMTETDSNGNEVLFHVWMTAGETALDLLERYGVVTSVDDVYYKVKPEYENGICP
jgi:hypothetical protein